MDATRTTLPQKILLSLLAFVFVFGLSPVGNTQYAYADASGGGESKGTFYLSISDDDKYVESDGEISGTTMAYVPLSIDEIAKIDLDDYGLGAFKYDPDGGTNYRVTLLMAFVYALDTYYSGTASELVVTGSSGSMFMQDGFWGHDCNLTYYVNGAYPLEYAGWGATADHIVIDDGDYADVSMYSDWNFYTDSQAGYHYFLDGTGAITHSYTTTAGSPLSVSLGRCWGDMMMGGDSIIAKEADYTVSYASEYGAGDAKTVTTDSEGAAQITFDKGGTYVLWVDGGLGSENPDSIVSSPGYAIVTVNEAAKVATTELASGVVGQEYSAKLEMTGMPAPTAEVTGLPEGLTFDSATNTISGTPTAAGKSTVTVTATNSLGTNTAELSLSVNEAPHIVTTTLPDATTGSEYSAALSATVDAASSTDDLSWWVSGDGLPAGLTMSEAGVISGTPTQAGTYTFSVIAADKFGASAAQELTLNVKGAAGIITTELASGVVGQEYSAKLDIAGTPAPTVTVEGLPAGLAFDSSTNTISGTPTAAGKSTVKVTATGVGTDTAELALVINEAAQIKTAELANASVDTAYSQAIEVSGTPAPSVKVVGLPEGLSFNASTMKIEGAAVAGTGGTYQIAITASNGVGEDATATLALAVREKASIVTESLDKAYVGQEYSATIETSGYPKPNFFLFSGSTLPAGLSMNTDGVISGIPTETGTFKISVLASNSVGASSMKTFELTVGEKAPLKSLIMHTNFSPSTTTTLIMNKGNSYKASTIFDPSIFEYTTASVLDSTTQMRFRAAAGADGASVVLHYGKDMSLTKDITWTSGSSKFANDCPAGGGLNTIELVATPAKGSDLDPATYTIHIPVTPTLTALSATSDAGNVYFDKKFAAGTNEYTLTVPSSATKVNFATTATTTDYAGNDYVVTYNGSSSSSVKVAGIDKVEVAVTAGTGDNAVTNTYTVNLKKVASYAVSFDTTPDDAIVCVTDSDGAAIQPNAKGEYVGMFGDIACTYTVTKTGYVAATGSVPAENTTIKVELKEAGEQPAAVDSDWWNFRNSANNMGITNVATPIDTTDTSLNWAKKIGTGWTAAPSQPLIVDDTLVTCVNKNIYKLDLHTGETIASGTMTAATNWGYTPMTYANGMIFVPISKGVQAFDATTLKSLWVYQDDLGGQSLSPIVYSDGYIYTGFWNSETKDAHYVCLSVTDEDPTQTTETKVATWKHTQAGGFYWAGGVAIGDKIIVGTDDGASGMDGASHLLVFDKTTGAVEQSLDITGDQRSSIAYDEANGQIWFTTKCGYLYRANVNAATGKVSNLKGVSFGAQSTSTPVVYKGKVYIGTGSGISTSGSSGNIGVFDAKTMNLLYFKTLNGYPQSSLLLSTAYEESTGYIYLYSTYNAQPGGITMLKLKADATTADEVEKVEIYDAAGYKQYCISSIICGTDGTLYYKNDSGNILAVGKTYTAPVVTSTTLDNAVSGSEYKTKLEATAYPEDVTWKLAEGSTLPEGLELAADGTISGTVATADTYKFSVVATNLGGSSEATEVTLTVDAPFSIATEELPKAYKGYDYSYQLTAAGNGADSVTWSKTAGSSWVSVSKDGVISGTPSYTSNNYYVTVNATNANGVSVTKRLSLPSINKYKSVSGTAYVSVSKDGKFIASDGTIAGTNMDYVEVNLAEVSKIDLDSYNLGDYKYDADGDGTYEVTELQLMLYVLDNYYSGKAADGFAVDAQWSSPGAMWITKFWGMTSPYLTYSVNGATPLDEANKMLTADRVVLAKSNDYSINLYADSSFYGDSNAVDHFFVNADSNIVHSADAYTGEATSFSLQQVKYSMGETGATTVAKSAAANYTVSYGTTYGTATGTATTDDKGNASITFPSAGTWYVWADGAYGKEHPTTIVSSPASVTVTVADKVAPAITTTDLGNIRIGETPTVSLTATGTPAEFKWTLAEGSTLPEGLTLNEDGTFSGQPTREGTYKFTVSCSNGVGTAATKEVSVKVVPKYEAATGTVYMSISYNGLFVPADGQTATADGYMDSVAIDLADVRATIDLDTIKTASNDLSKFKYDADGDGSYDVTYLMVMLYAAQNYSAAGVADFNFSGYAHSAFIKGGFFGLDSNTQYYQNYAAALDASLGPNMGATADAIVVEDGDVLDVAGWSDMMAAYVGYSPFDWFVGESTTVETVGPNAIVTSYEATAGEPVTVKMAHAVSNMWTMETSYALSSGVKLHTGTSYNIDSAFTSDIVTDEDGAAQITFDLPGTYYVWADGYESEEYGDTYTSSSAAIAKVVVHGAPVAKTTALPDGVAEQEYSAQIEAYTVDEVTWMVKDASTLPEGLTLADDGTISGTPAKMGDYTIDVVATNEYGVSSPATVTLHIDGFAPQIVTEALDNGTYGKEYSATIETTAQPAASVYLSGKLPEGLSASNGVISGVPAQTGTFEIKAVASNDYGTTDVQTFTLTIDADKAKLAESIDGASKDLEATKVSADGKDLPKSETYVTSEEAAALQTAIEAAQAVRDSADASQADVDAAAKAIADAQATFDAAKKTVSAVTDWTRLSGQSRYETMAAISQAGYADGSASKIILTTASGYADALSASSLSGLWNAPIILTATDSLSAEAAAEIARVSDGNATVYIIGGEGAVSASAEEAAAAIDGISGTQRISGANRVDTGLKIYEAGGDGWGNTAVISNAWSFADALSISSWASAAGAPIFGATDGVLSADEVEAIKAGGFTSIVVVGGDNAVNLDAVKAQLPEGIGYVRLAGDSRLATSAAIANWTTGNAEISGDIAFQPSVVLSYDNVAVATAWNYPDALAAIDLVGPNKSVLLLVDESDASKANIEATIGANASNIKAGYVLGGSAAVSDTVKAWCEEATK